MESALALQAAFRLVLRLAEQKRTAAVWRAASGLMREAQRAPAVTRAELSGPPRRRKRQAPRPTTGRARSLRTALRLAQAPMTRGRRRMLAERGFAFGVTTEAAAIQRAPKTPWVTEAVTLTPCWMVTKRLREARAAES